MSNYQELMRRVRKDGRYSVLTTNTMRLAKQYKVYENARNIAKELEIKTQKNYYFSVLKMTLVFAFLVEEKNLPYSVAKKVIFDYLQKNLEPTLNEKFQETNEKLYLDLVRDRSKFDLLVFGELFDTNSPNQVNKILKKLYEKNSVNQHSEETKLLSKIYLDNLPNKVSGQAAVSTIAGSFHHIQNQDSPADQSRPVQEPKNDYDLPQLLNYWDISQFLSLDPQKIPQPTEQVASTNNSSSSSASQLQPSSLQTQLRPKKERSIASYGNDFGDAIIESLIFKS